MTTGDGQIIQVFEVAIRDWCKSVLYIACFFAAEVWWLRHLRHQTSRRLKGAIPGLAIALIGALVEIASITFFWTTVHDWVVAWSNSWTASAWSVLPSWAALIFGILLVDLTVYVVHRLFHTVPFLWRFHRVHHADLHYSAVTTKLHHPVSRVLEEPLGAILGAALGIPSTAGIAYGLIQRWNSYFQHTRIVFPERIERLLSVMFILPRHHALHHSRRMGQTNTNYCFIFSIWDRIFGTFCDDPIGPEFEPGLDEFVAQEHHTLQGMLLNPFRDVDAPAGDDQKRAA